LGNTHFGLLATWIDRLSYAQNSRFGEVPNAVYLGFEIGVVRNCRNQRFWKSFRFRHFLQKLIDRSLVESNLITNCFGAVTRQPHRQHRLFAFSFELLADVFQVGRGGAGGGREDFRDAISPRILLLSDVINSTLAVG
jgi:hypothetical protein